MRVRDGARGWDDYAPFYDWENAQTVARRDVPFWCGLAAAQPGPILELGCGTGRIALPVARSGTRLVGIDRSAPMLERARRRLRRAQLADRALLIRGDIRALPFRRRTAFGCVMAPYGVLQSLTREPDLWPMRGKTGAVRLALADGIPLIPMAHWGAQDILPRYGKLSFWPLRRRVKVIVGDPVDISEFRGKTAQPAALAAGTDRLMGAISQLLSQLRGEPAPEKRWNPAEHGQRETGRLEP